MLAVVTGGQNSLDTPTGATDVANSTLAFAVHRHGHRSDRAASGT